MGTGDKEDMIVRCECRKNDEVGNDGFNLHVSGPGVLRSMKKYRVWSLEVSNTPLCVPVGANSVTGFWRCKVSRIGFT